MVTAFWNCVAGKATRTVRLAWWLPLLLTLLGPNVRSASARAVVITAEELSAAIAAAVAGDTIEVAGGVFHGTVHVDKRLNLIGREWPVIDGGGQGTVMKVTAPGAVIQGFLIRNSGSSLDQENSGIAVEAPNVVIAYNRFEETLFGIYLRQAHGSTVRGNVIRGKDFEVPRRGDAIRVWDSDDVLVEANQVEQGRDVVLWYSERLTVRDNVVSGGRYGLHFMYCDDALVSQNRLSDNSVGAFLMYSRRLTLQNNVIAKNRGPSGYGVGLKDMDDAIVVDNLFLDNRVGAHLDGSPREVDSIGRFQGNVFAYNDIGVNMMPAVRHNEFDGNSFIDNEEQVAVAGGGQLRENSWTVAEQGNYWSDYAGFDADGDGSGDLEYRSERFFESLMARSPELRLFLYSPATSALDFAARAFPLVRPRPKLVDTRPMMAPVIPVAAPRLERPPDRGWVGLGLALTLLSLAVPWLLGDGRNRYRFPPVAGGSDRFRRT